MKNRSFLFRFTSGLLLILIWQVLGMIINNDIFLPTPVQTINTMFYQLFEDEFIKSLMFTLNRLVLSFLIAIVITLVMTIISRKYQLIRIMVEQVLLVIRVVPTAAFILIALIWLGRDRSVLLISIIVMVPLMYDQLYHRLHEIDDKYRDPLLLYGDTFIENILHVYVPLSLSSFYTICKSASLLGLKVIVTSEVIVSIQHGLGKDMSIASRIDLNNVRLFADTGWILLFAIVVSYGFDFLIQQAKNKEFENGK